VSKASQLVRPSLFRDVGVDTRPSSPRKMIAKAEVDSITVQCGSFVAYALCEIGKNDLVLGSRKMVMIVLSERDIMQLHRGASRYHLLVYWKIRYQDQSWKLVIPQNHQDVLRRARRRKLVTASRVMATNSEWQNGFGLSACEHRNNDLESGFFRGFYILPALIAASLKGTMIVFGRLLPSLRLSRTPLSWKTRSLLITVTSLSVVELGAIHHQYIYLASQHRQIHAKRRSVRSFILRVVVKLRHQKDLVVLAPFICETHAT
jgi:hypothetical protein